MMRSTCLCPAALLLVLAMVAGPASAVTWMAGSLDDAMAAARTQNKPLLIYAFVQKLAETDTTTSAELDCQQMEQIVLNSPLMADLLGRFVCLRVNVRVNETLFARVGAPRKVPSLIFLRPGESEACAHVGGVVVGATEEEVIGVVTDRVNAALAICDLGRPGTTLTDAQKPTLAQAYLSLGMRREAIPLLQAVLDAGGRVDKDSAIVLSLLYLMSGEDDKALALLNSTLEGVRVRPWTADKDTPLFLPDAGEYTPIVFEKPDGRPLGVTYAITNNLEFADLIRKVEFLAARVAPPQDVPDGLYAANVGDACFKIENTRLALAYYERARLDAALPLDRLETAWARIALCHLYLEDLPKARTEMELFLSKFTRVESAIDPEVTHYRPQIMVYLAATYDRLGDTQGARRLYQQVVDEYGGTGFDEWAAAAKSEIRVIDLEAAREASRGR